MILLYVSTAVAGTGQNEVYKDCVQTLEKADKALEAKNKALSLADLGLKACQDNAGSLKTEVNALRESEAKWYRNPFVMFFFGAGATSAAYLVLKK